MAIKIIGFLSFFHIFCSKIPYLQGILYNPSPKAEETLGKLGCRLQSLIPFTEENQTPKLKKLVLVMLGHLAWCHRCYIWQTSPCHHSHKHRWLLCLNCLCCVSGVFACLSIRMQCIIQEGNILDFQLRENNQCGLTSFSWSEGSLLGIQGMETLVLHPRLSQEVPFILKKIFSADELTWWTQCRAEE